MTGENTPQPENESILKARAKAQRTAAAFEMMFGQPRGRTASQKLVLEHLETCAGDDSNSYRFNDAHDGISRIAAGIHRDGAKSILRIINRQLLLATQVKEPPKVTTATVKK